MTPEELRRLSPGPIVTWFHVTQTIQSSLAVAFQLAFFALYLSKKSLQSRSITLLLSLAFSDLLFATVLLIFGGVRPLATGVAIAGLEDCAFTTWWYVFTLFLSISSYTVIAYERYREGHQSSPTAPHASPTSEAEPAAVTRDGAARISRPRLQPS
jgi:hypothetical protein